MDRIVATASNIRLQTLDTGLNVNTKHHLTSKQHHGWPAPPGSTSFSVLAEGQKQTSFPELCSWILHKCECALCGVLLQHPSVLGAIPPVQLCANKLDLKPGPDPACLFTSLITVLYFLREPNVDLSLTFSLRSNAGKIIWQLVYVSVGPVSLLKCLFR